MIKKKFSASNKGYRQKFVPPYLYRRRSRRKIFDFRNINRRYFKLLFFQARAFNRPSLRLTRTFRPNYITSFFAKDCRLFFYYSKRVGSYNDSPLREVPRRFNYFVFPEHGLNSRALAVRNKYFFKRRSINNFFKYNLFHTKSFNYKTTSKFFSSFRLYLHIGQTKNNLFFYLKTGGGRLVFSYTNGQTIYKGSRRTTPTASELAGKQVAKFLALNKIKDICLVFNTPLTSLIKSSVRGLATCINFSGILAYRFCAHNGMKIRATRRV